MRLLRTARLRLVPVTPANAEVLWDVLQRPGLRDFQDLPDVGKAQFARIVAQRPAELRAGAGGRYEWLLYFERGASAEQPIGWVSLRVSERVPPSGEVGYSVVVEQRNRGIASEALDAIVEEAFARVGLHELRAYCVPGNVASLGVLRRCGFRGDGLTAHGATVNGRSVDVAAFSLARERWEELTHRRSAIGS